MSNFVSNLQCLIYKNFIFYTFSTAKQFANFCDFDEPRKNVNFKYYNINYVSIFILNILCKYKNKLYATLHNIF